MPFTGQAVPVTYQAPKITPAFMNKKPTDPKRSWLYFKAYFLPVRERKVVRQSTMEEPDDESGANLQSTEGMTFPTPSGTATADVIQQGGKSSYSVRYIGHANRAGYLIPRPALTSIGGQPATETGGKFLCRQVGLYFGVPVYAAAWMIDYSLPNSPGTIKPPTDLSN